MPGVSGVSGRSDPCLSATVLHQPVHQVPAVCYDPIMRVKPTLFKRHGEWACKVMGATHDRMGAGATPAAAYENWKFWNSAVGEVVGRATWAPAAS